MAINFSLKYAPQIKNWNNCKSIFILVISVFTLRSYRYRLFSHKEGSILRLSSSDCEKMTKKFGFSLFSFFFWLFHQIPTVRGHYLKLEIKTLQPPDESNMRNKSFCEVCCVITYICKIFQMSTFLLIKSVHILTYARS